MSGVVCTVGRWQVSTRPAGEVLVVSGEDGGVAIAIFGAQHPASDTEARLLELLRVARATAQSVAGPIPGLLHQTLARLLASDVLSGARVPSVAVLFDRENEVTLGLIGNLEQQAWIDHQAVEIPWIRLRDKAGREARAYRFTNF